MSKRGWLLFAAMSVIWGIPYLLIKVALEGMPAPFIVFARTAIGAAVLLPVAWKRGMVGPALKHWRYIAAFAALEIAGPWLLLGDAEQHMTSSLAGLLIAAVPFFVALIMWRLGERSAVSGTRLAGLFIGMAGVVAIVGLNIGQVQVLRMLEVIAVAVGYAIAPIIADRKLAGVPTLATITLSLTGVALLYVPIAAFSHPTHTPRANALGAVAALGLICTASAFLLFFELIGEVGPAKSSMITFVNPAVAVAGGVLFLGETIKAGIIVGAPLVLIGLILSTLRRGDAVVPAAADALQAPAAAAEEHGPEAAMA
ncbi:DMT family transporter [Catenulispora sp. GP43]|uniref:DMT family transporter n=1 Tax=Catenulispora sp. GP43 TaxID=3156263 RepID=UPI003513EDFD